MPAEIISGKKISEEIKAEIKSEVSILRARGIIPGLAAVLAGDNPASALYVKMKAKACEEVGIYSDVIAKDRSCGQSEILDLIDELNARDDIDGILVQSPLPDHLDEAAVTFEIDPGKDVDGLHPVNAGLLLAGRPAFEPATPLGILELLDRSGHNPGGKSVVILGRGRLVGRPLAVMLAHKSSKANATVTVCHTGTKDIAWHTRNADIVIAAMGKARFLTGDMIRPGAVVIDVGTNQIDDPAHLRGKRVVGDVDFESVNEVAGALTPVPGGVGPMTIASLLQNTLKACRRRHNLD